MTVLTPRDRPVNLRWLNGDPVIVTRDETRCEFRPAPLYADATFTLFLIVGVGNLGLAGFLLWVGRGSFIGPLFGGLGTLVAAGAFWQAMRARRLQHIPLIIDKDGRVSYGDRELCPAESVQAIQLKRVPSGEDYSYKVSLLLAEGAEVELPSPYFTSFFYRQQARSFAERLAAALQLNLVDAG